MEDLSVEIYATFKNKTGTMEALEIQHEVQEFNGAGNEYKVGLAKTVISSGLKNCDCVIQLERLGLFKMKAVYIFSSQLQ